MGNADITRKTLEGVKNINLIHGNLVPSLDFICLTPMSNSPCELYECKDGKILVYMPPGASKMEQFKATHAANQIRDEDHAGSATVEILSMNTCVN